jgi:hypothetical protein
MNPPVRLIVEPPSSGPRNRLSALLRPILAIPHLLLVGGPALGFLGGGYRFGALGALAFLAAVFDWFAILFGSGPVSGLQSWKRLYLVWRARALAYAAFLRDEYPPFGQGDYPVTLDLPPEPATRDRSAVALRPVLVLPHLLVLMFLVMAWVVVAFVSWIWLVVNGTMPASLWRFTRDVLGYSLRVEAYALLIHDEFPPFALTEAPTPGEMPGESARV